MTTFHQLTLECPNCKSRSQTYETMSYHVHSSIIFSDGKVESRPPTPINNSILICPECKKAFWREDAKSEDYSYEDEKSDLPQTMDVHDLPFAFEDDFTGKLANYYQELLDTGFATSNEKEVLLRIEIWHLLNNKIRNKSNRIYYNIKTFGFKYVIKSFNNRRKKRIEFDENKKQFNLNLKKLISIFKPEFEEQNLLLAEMYRERGDFKNAIFLLEEMDSLENPSAYKQILKASKRRKMEVFKINQK